MNQSFIIYIIQNMLLISLFTLALFFIGTPDSAESGTCVEKNGCGRFWRSGCCCRFRYL